MNNSSILRAGALVAAVVLIGLVVYFGHAPTPVAQAPVATVAFSCDANKGIIAAFYTGETKQGVTPDAPPIPGGKVVLALSDGRSLTLAQTISADGSRYASADESFVFWGKGNGALVLEGGKEKDFKGCIVIAPEVMGVALPLVYSNSSVGFSIRLPAGYTVNESYRYQARGPGKDIPGVSFTIASSTAHGTNLSADTHMSLERVQATSTESICSARTFLDATPVLVNDGNTTYSVASTTGAGAGNRYAEIVYAIPGTNPCVALRYYIHSTVYENYPTGTVQRFDETMLRAQFDAIRRTLVLAR